MHFIIGEKPVDAIERIRGSGIFTAGFTCPARQPVWRGPVHAARLCLADRCLQASHIAQPQVDALACEGMHHVRGIAHQQHFARDIGLGQLPSQRERSALGHHAHFAQPR